VCLIYLARNTVNGKGYVGRTTRTLKERMKRHLEDAKRECVCAFHRAIQKYGLDAFEWLIFYQDDDNDRDWMDWWERRFIRKLGTRLDGYNMTDGGDGFSFGHSGFWTGKRRSEETKKKISERVREIFQRPEIRKRLSESHIGKKLPRQQIEKIVKANTGQKRSEEAKKRIGDGRRGKGSSAKGRPITEEHKRKISESHIGKKLSEEHRMKCSNGRRGKPSWNKGITGGKLSDEHKKKISDSLRKYNKRKNELLVIVGVEDN